MKTIIIKIYRSEFKCVFSFVTQQILTRDKTVVAGGGSLTCSNLVYPQHWDLFAL